MREELDIEVDDIKVKIKTKQKRKKSMSVVKYDQETDTSFHDIDMNEFWKWKENHEREYQDDLKILKRLEAMCPRKNSVYSWRSAKNNEQKKEHPFYSVLYGFHKAANENYLEMYRAESTKKRRKYEALKEKAMQYLKTPPVFEDNRVEEIYSILKEIGL